MAGAFAGPGAGARDAGPAGDAAVDAEGAPAEEAWASVKWAERYYASERDPADAMPADLDEPERRRP
ncbi:hypothetical protein GCM10010377_71690 [Streptomyces viridiviolaceus]|nr:hypothetical protein GCM10010377_71690 [Streptomyces viridiviolaceus]